MNTQRGLLIFLAFILAGLSKKHRNLAIEKIIDIAQLFEHFRGFLDEDGIDKVLPKTEGIIIKHDELEQSFSSVFASINSFFAWITKSLQAHAESILIRIEEDEDKRPWKIFGFLFQLGFLVLFAYADVIQLVNNLAPLLGADADRIPAVFQNLSVALLMSSIGIAIACGFIIAEFGGLTEFGGWNELQGGIRTIVLIIVWVSFLSALAIDGVLALARIRTMPEAAELLTPEMSATIFLASAVASTLVIIPMLLVTFLFFQGFVGIAMIYILFIYGLALVIELIHLVFIGIIWLLTYGISYVVVFIARIIVWILHALISIISWFLMAASILIVKLLEFAQTLIDIIYFPMDSIIGWLVTRVS